MRKVNEPEQALAQSNLSTADVDQTATKLNHTIDIMRRAIADVQYDLENKAAMSGSFGYYHRSQFDQLGKLGDIESAIKLDKEAVRYTPDSHAHKADRLTNLG